MAQNWDIKSLVWKRYTGDTVGFEWWAIEDTSMVVSSQEITPTQEIDLEKPTTKEEDKQIALAEKEYKEAINKFASENLYYGLNDSETVNEYKTIFKNTLYLVQSIFIKNYFFFWLGLKVQYFF